MWLQNKDVYPHAIWDAWYTHTQMAHGKKSWFCSHFSPLFLFFLHDVEKLRKMKKSGEKCRKVKNNIEKPRKWRKVKQNEENWKNEENQEHVEKWKNGE